MNKFFDRHEAGLVLAGHLKQYANNPNVIVLALPRGGVPVAFEIATKLSLPLDVFIVRKLGIPGNEEVAMGAIASGGTLFLDKPLIKNLHLDPRSVQNVIEKEKKELIRRTHVYRGTRPFPALEEKTILLVDDGIATGATIRAAIEALRKHKPKALVIAVPVAAYATCEELTPLVETLICPLKPRDFQAVGLWYEQFPQTADEEVIDLVKKASNL